MILKSESVIQSKGQSKEIYFSCWLLSLDRFSLIAFGKPCSQGLSSHHPKGSEGKESPSLGWSRCSQMVGDDKKTIGRVAILFSLNPLWKGKICLKFGTSSMCHSINCEGRCRRHMQRLLTQEVLGGSASLLDILLTIKIPWKSKSCVARCRRRDLTFPSEEWIIASFAS